MTVALVHYTTPYKRTKHGLCSRYLGGGCGDCWLVIEGGMGKHGGGAWAGMVGEGELLKAMAMFM